MTSRRLPFLAAMLAATTISTGAAPKTFNHLNPGGLPDLRETVPVNIVFVGYEPSQVGQSAFLADLPATYQPVVRSRLWYGVIEANESQ